ncbi:biotin--[acetyl-CoA-carboxylase] ligase [Hoylesella pleuritidis]|jgi:biotin--[acetyl-coA-carboxylase] ligase|uniref:Biotin-(Acetyl-CoA-carboxylase) ligase n=1 Tax=Hoylesella pleuritidis F0068 TaxID=1081904 RepID=U2L3K6_9BACT|nr:biotin--[acetyl-CoA-carboxylase] ligase [Hoylesella pleuritidis]ERJ99097.1 biotin-(acetyl-CoA-carboxylase) ligase [Hoylesella pleuritidis F0068]
MRIKTLRFKEIDSTNRFLCNYQANESEEMTVAVADFQTAGRGMGTNTWESEAGQNLLFSILVHPRTLPITRQFQLSMAQAIALKEVLDEYTDGITVKWPNDIYWQNRKISGTRIDTSISSQGIKNFVLGTGLNVNQREFHSDAPNPVSLFQILGYKIDPDLLLNKIITRFEKYYHLVIQGYYSQISTQYHAALYRTKGLYKYSDKTGDFQATILRVEDNGHLILRDSTGKLRQYAFKELTFII